MKKIWMSLALTVGFLSTYAQSSLDKTHIPEPPNATFQNNAQFYNKDNKNVATREHIMTTGNGTYWAPGYSNDANRVPYTIGGMAPNTSVNSSVNSSGNSYYNNTSNYSTPNTSDLNSNRSTPTNINSNVYRP